MAKTQRFIDLCLDFITDGKGEVSTVREKLIYLDQAEERVQKSMEQDAMSIKVETQPNTGHLYRRWMEKLCHLITDGNACEEALSIIRSLINRIYIIPGTKRGDPSVQLVGGLAGILKLAISRQQKTAIQKDSGVRRVMLVAGVGFEPTTFRL